MFSYPTSLLIVAGLLLSFANDVQPTAPVVREQEPRIASEQVFGSSTEGREIWGFEFGSGDECLLFFGGIHGNERGTVELMNTLTSELLTHPEYVPANKRVVVIPLLNPDGYLDREDKLSANEVNLNRNFATDDWIRQEGGPETFAGSKPFSEVESRLLRDVVDMCDPTIMIAFHSQGALVSPEFNQNSVVLAKWYAEQTGYKYFDEWDYAGTATRWFVETTDNAAITVELTSHEDSDWEMNRSALLEIIAR